MSLRGLGGKGLGKLVGTLNSDEGAEFIELRHALNKITRGGQGANSSRTKSTNFLMETCLARERAAGQAVLEHEPSSLAAWRRSMLAQESI